MGTIFGKQPHIKRKAGGSRPGRPTRAWGAWAACLALVMGLAVAGSITRAEAGAGSSARSAYDMPAANGVPRPDHVVIAIEENHSYSEIIGSPNAPYINSLPAQGALFTQSHAIEHPSQPNYLDFFSGSNQGITDDSCPHSFATPNLEKSLLDASFTFAGYSEDLPSVGSTVCTSGAYARKHAPWVNFTNVPTSNNLPYTSFPTDYSTLPSVSFVIPNLNHDMHDGTIQQGDTWLQQRLDGYAQWAKTHNSLFILTFDEDDSSQSNRIATIFVGQMVAQGQYPETINHFNMLRTLEDMYDLPYAGVSGSYTPITDVWVGGGTATPTNTPTAVPSNTPIPSSTPTSTPTSTSIPTSTSTSTAVATPAQTATHIPTQTPTPTAPTATFIPTNTSTPLINTSTPTNTSIPANTSTSTNTPTSSYTYTSTPTNTPTYTPLPTQTPGGATATPQPSDTPTNTSTNTPTPSDTPVPATATATPATCSIQFTDVPEGSTFYPFIRCMACRGIVSGYSEGCEGGSPCFRPDSSVTRGQLAKIVSNAAAFSDPPVGQTFEDVPPGSTFYTYTQRLTSRLVMSGYPCDQDPSEPCNPPLNRPYFRPYANTIRGQIAKIVSNAAGFYSPVEGQTFEDVAPDTTYYTYTERLYAHGVMGGYPCGDPDLCIPPANRPYFHPYSNATRGQTSKIVSNTFYPNCQTPDWDDR